MLNLIIVVHLRGLDFAPLGIANQVSMLSHRWSNDIEGSTRKL